jgi:hypothetical protein
MKMHDLLLGHTGDGVSYDPDLLALVPRSNDSSAGDRRKEVVLLFSCRVRQEVKYASDRNTLSILGHSQLRILDDVFPDELFQNFGRVLGRRFYRQEGSTRFI